MALMALRAASLLVVLTSCLAAVPSQTQDDARLYDNDNTTVAIGYQALLSAVSVVLFVGFVAVVVALIVQAQGSSSATSYQEPTGYASEPAAAYDRVYSVFNALKEAARKYQ